MRRLTAIGTMFGICAMALLLMLPAGYAGDISKGKALEMVLSAVKAARTVYVKGVMAVAKKGGLKGNEDWVKDEHGIMLPAQFVKEIGKEIRSFELGLIGTDPLYASNAAKSDVEKKLLAELAGGKKMASVEDGGKTIAMSADFAIVQGCADCHNEHPKTTKKDWKKGDFMGAIVARMK